MLMHCDVCPSLRVGLDQRLLDVTGVVCWIGTTTAIPSRLESAGRRFADKPNDDTAWLIYLFTLFLPANFKGHKAKEWSGHRD